MLTVTRLEPQKRNPQRLNVYLDGEFAFGISRTAAAWLSEGDQLSEGKVEDLKARDQIESAYQRALHFLSYRGRSSQEIRLNLRKHQIEDPVIDQVLDRLGQASLVDDLAFARQWIENRSRFRPRGKRALAVELTQKGICREIIEETLQDLDEETLAWSCARDKAPHFRGLDKAEFQKKLSSYLNRRGFPYGTTREVVAGLWQELGTEST